jgi:large subunit ribosomal protein L2
MASPIRVVRPTTSARRKMSYVVHSDITKKSPEKSLTIALKKHAGRDIRGRISIRHRGGGAKRMYRLVDFSGLKTIGQKARVDAIEYDPNRSAYIALATFESGKKAYFIAPQDLKVGSNIVTDEKAPLTTGNRMPLAMIPTGTPIHNIELTPGKGGQLARSAGTSAVVLAKEGNYAQVRLPSGEVRLIHLTAFATIGEVSNPSHNTVRIAKAGRVRHMGRRPQVRGKAMNPVDHPHGGGEGHSSIGLKHPKTPTGKPALGYRTRRNKSTNPFIVRRRGKKR